MNENDEVKPFWGRGGYLLLINSLHKLTIDLLSTGHVERTQSRTRERERESLRLVTDGRS